jgi:hypothetical protein
LFEAFFLVEMRLGLWMVAARLVQQIFHQPHLFGIHGDDAE